MDGNDDYNNKIQTWNIQFISQKEDNFTKSDAYFWKDQIFGRTENKKYFST